MTVTSAQAAKMLRQLKDELRTLEVRERSSRSFIASIQEDIESVRPFYHFREMQEAKAAVEGKIRKLKHAINVFNTTTMIPEFDMTIDEMLIYLPQLHDTCSTLSAMKDVLPKVRVQGIHSNGTIVDYQYANYDIGEVEKAYIQLSECLAKAQTALDVVNNTVTFEIEI